MTGSEIVLVEPERMERDERYVRRRFWDKVKRTLGRVPFLEDAIAAYFCAVDEASPPYVRATLLGALAYFILPVDAIPDLIAGLGFTDDLAVLLAAVRAVGSNITEAHRARARAVVARLQDSGARSEEPGFRDQGAGTSGAEAGAGVVIDAEVAPPPQS